MDEKTEKECKEEKKEKKVKREDKEGKEPKEKKEQKKSTEGEIDTSALDQRKLFKEGQRNLTPPMADPTRGFYESLIAENPESKIAIRWCIEFGVLSNDKHMALLKKYNHLKEKGAFSVQ